MTESLMIELGRRIRAARLERSWSQSELADAAGVSRPSVARSERGSDMSTATLAKISEALGLVVDVRAIASTGEERL